MFFDTAAYPGVMGVLPTANGGTGGSTPAAARTNLDVYSKSETDSAIQQSAAIVDITQSYTCQSTSWEYTGVSIEIPAHACYGLMGVSIFANAQPQGAAFSFSSTNMLSYNAVGVAEVGNTCVCGYNNNANPITLYLWGKWNGPSTNMASIRGWIR